MGEPMRFKLKAIWKNEDIPSWIVCATPKPAIPPEEISVREDRATESDREKIAKRLAEYAPLELDICLETADELLALVFGDGASRV